MKWMQRPGRLLKKLEGTSHPGVRLRLIREARNNTSEFKGKFGYRDLCEHLVKCSAIKDSVDGRKLIGMIEDGFKDISKEPQLIDPWLKFLDVSRTDVFLGGAGVNELKAAGSADSTAEPADASASSQSHNKPLRPNHVTNEITVFNHCEGLNLEVFLEQDASDGSITIRIFNDEPVPEAFSTRKIGFRTGKAWVPQPVNKYQNSVNKEDRKTLERKVLVKLE